MTVRDSSHVAYSIYWFPWCRMRDMRDGPEARPWETPGNPSGQPEQLAASSSFLGASAFPIHRVERVTREGEGKFGLWAGRQTKLRSLISWVLGNHDAQWVCDFR